MEKFKIGSRVVFTYNGETKTGVVENMFNIINMALVNVSTESTLYKIAYSDILSVEPEPEESDVPASITITPDEFKEITEKVIVKTLEDNAVVKMLQLFCQLLERELFEKAEND